MAFAAGRTPRGIARRDALALAGAGSLTAATAALSPARPASAAAAAWSPLSLAGCDAWFDAGTPGAGMLPPTGPATAAAVRSLGNLAGGLPAIALTGAPTLAPSAVSGRPQLQFTGREDLTSSVAADPHIATYVVVVEQSTISAGAVIGTGGGGGDDGFELRVNEDGTITGARSGVWDIGTSTRSITAGRPAVVAFQFDSNGIWACYVDGQAAGTGRTSFELRAGTRLALGSSSGSQTPAYTGAIAEVVRYRRALPGHELLALHRYLSAKWAAPLVQRVGATAALPRLHALVGSNIAPKLAQYTGGSPWRSFWADWDEDWVTASIDVARASGSDAVRTIGDVDAVASGRITQSQYLARVEQVIDACASRGMRYYPCGFSLQAVGGADDASVRGQLQATARLLNAHPTVVVGFDLINELASNYGAVGQERAVTLALSLAQAVRAVAPELPITVSDIGDLQWGALSRSTPLSLYRRFAPHVDFFDIHVYAPAADLRSWQLAPYELTIDRPLVIGEFGIDAEQVGEQAAADYYAMVRLLASSTPAVAGVFQWAAIDDRFGLQTETNAVRRTRVAAEWARFPALFS